MDKDMPADWAIERACELANAMGAAWNMKDAKDAYGIRRSGDTVSAFARYIEAHEQPPVDPDREALIDVLLCLGIGPDEYTIPQFKAALAKLKEARGK